MCFFKMSTKFTPSCRGECIRNIICKGLKISPSRSVFHPGFMQFLLKSTTALEMVENATFSNARSENVLTRVCIFRILFNFAPSAWRVSCIRNRGCKALKTQKCILVALIPRVCFCRIYLIEGTTSKWCY